MVRGVPYIKESVTSVPMLFSVFFTPQDFHIYWFPPAMAQWLGAEFTIFRHWRSEGHQGLLPISGLNQWNCAFGHGLLIEV